jgi:hypothetical protein
LDLSNLMKVPYPIGPFLDLLTLVVSAGIGVLFDYLPACRAVRKGPIEALENE